MSGWWGLGSAKKQFIRQLRERVGREGLVSFAPPFVFDSSGNRWTNIDQLEAVVEFYMNFREPWGGQDPLRPGDDGYVTVNLHDPAGQAATLGNGKVVTLDGDPDLSDVVVNPARNPAAGAAAGGASPPGYPPRLRYLYDTLWLDTDTGRPSKTYRIMAVDNAANMVTLDAVPNCPGNTSPWRLNRRPTIVIIDPLGPRVRVGTTTVGTNATVARTDPADPDRTILHLDDNIALDRVNAGFDTIHLDTDTVRVPERPGPAYRIVAVDPVAHEVTVAGAPSLRHHVSTWQIPSGVGGVEPEFNYDLGPQRLKGAHDPEMDTRGYDHYDGALFLVYRGRVEGERIYRWTSYTSRVYGTWSPKTPEWKQSLSSLGGNARYYFSGYRSGGDFKNYSFAVVDVSPSPTGLSPVKDDSVAAAKFYTGTPSPPAPGVAGDPDILDSDVWPDDNQQDRPGKGAIRLHEGSKFQFGSGSAGCMVSPEYTQMRTELIKLYYRDYVDYYGPGVTDLELDKIVNSVTIDASKALYDGKTAPPEEEWKDKVVGTLWLVRPDELPINSPPKH
jgi:hypothetical protein